MPAKTTHHLRNIEFTALKGKALASVLSISSSLNECTYEDIQLSLCALEDYFKDILVALSDSEIPK